jgi:hypothetical protein
MPAEYKNPDGSWSQGYFCWNCGKSVSLYAIGHGRISVNPIHN